MVWLVIIWLIAALCGFAAAAVWEPLLAMSLGIARTIDPGLASDLAQYAALVEGGGDAIGWIVALAVGLPLTLLWLGLRVVAGALRGPSDAPHRRDDPRRDARASVPRPPSVPAPVPTHSDADRPRPRGGTFDVPPPARGREAESGSAREHASPPSAPSQPDSELPDLKPPAERPPAADAPRWGRQ